MAKKLNDSLSKLEQRKNNGEYVLQYEIDALKNYSNWSFYNSYPKEQ